MTFTVTYRAKDGSLREETVEAADRAECVLRCKQCGIVPMSIRERRVSARTINGKSAASPNAPMIRRAVILAVAVLVVVGIGWWWFATRAGRAPYQAPETPRRVQPAEKPKAAPPPVAKSDRSPIAPTVTNTPAVSTNKPAAHKEETYIDERGIERYPGGMRVRRPAARTIKIEIDPLHRFKHTSEAQIAGLLEIKPGAFIVGDMKYSHRFVEDFKESLNDPIEILDTDSEYDKQLKRDVIETKKQLKSAMDRGEDIAQIMTDTRNELRKLGQYREELRQELHKIRTGGEYTEQEIEDFTVAANKLLADKGCRPIKMPTLLLRYIRDKQAKQPQQQN